MEDLFYGVIFLIIVFALLNTFFQTHKNLKMYAKENQLTFNESFFKFLCNGFVRNVNLIKQFAQDTLNKANEKNIIVKLSKKGLEDFNKKNAILLTIEIYTFILVIVVAIAQFIIYSTNITAEEALSVLIVVLFSLLVLVIIVVIMSLCGGYAFLNNINKVNQVYKEINN